MSMKSTLGYTWAVMGIPIMLVLIMGMDFWMNIFFIDSGVKYSERITGGEVKTVRDYGDYSAQIHEPVFEGLFKDTKSGFVQLDWISEKALPGRITEEVDYDGDGSVDFKLELNTAENTAQLFPYNSEVKALSGEKVMVLENQRTVRVNLEKEDT
ncbi:MAG: hypothetical protein PHC91_06385 [Eubacteriales bacterium]|nr:hypothetical protein [Eubacteriales bacterium]